MEAFLVTSLLKKELIAQTIGESTKSIFHNIGHVLDDEFKFKDLIEDLDLKSKIDIVNDIIKMDNKDINDTIHKALHYVHEIIEKIKNEIEEINKDVKEHKKLWFHKYRTPIYLEKVNKLIKHNSILDKRIDLLIKVISIKDKNLN